MGHPATPPSSGSTCLARREQRRARPQLLRPLPCEQTCRAPGRGEAAGLCGRGQPPPLQPGSALRPGIQGDEPWWGGAGRGAAPERGSRGGGPAGTGHTQEGPHPAPVTHLSHSPLRVVLGEMAGAWRDEGAVQSSQPGVHAPQASMEAVGVPPGAQLGVSTWGQVEAHGLLPR